MTVHMFRVFVGRGPMSVSDLEARIQTWKDEHTRWTGDSVDHTLKEYRDIDGTLLGHFIPIRFEQTETKANILQKLTDKLKEKVAWHRVGYHACDHDEQDATPCSWSDSAEWTAKDTAIPDGIPTFEVPA